MYMPPILTKESVTIVRTTAAPGKPEAIRDPSETYSGKFEKGAD